MPLDPVLSHELRSLQEEVAAARERQASPVLSPPPVAAIAPQETADERALRARIRMHLRV